MIQAIVAIDSKGGIATKKGIPWDIPNDRKYFKKMTMGKTVVMGRKTYEVIPAPLKDRTNIILTSTKSIRPGFEKETSVEAVFKKYLKNLVVIGGQDIYEAFMPVIDEILITVIEGDFKCNRFFPAYKKSYIRVYKGRKFSQNGYVYHYERWQKPSIN